MKAEAADKPAVLLAPPDTPHDFAYVPDVARAVLTLLDAPGLVHGFGAPRQPERLHATDPPALATADGCQRFGQPPLVPREVGPIFLLVDVARHGPHGMRRMWPLFSAGGSLITGAGWRAATNSEKASN